MAQLPTRQNNAVQVGGNAPGYQSVAFGPEAFGGNSARALAQLGETTQRTASAWGQFRIESGRVIANNQALDEVNNLNAQKREAFYGQNGFLARRGGAAIGAQQDASAFMQKLGEERLAAITDPQTRQSFQRLWSRETEASLDATARHEMGEYGTYQTQVQAGSLATAMQSVYDDPTNDAIFAASVTKVQEAIGANSMGLPDEVVTAAQAEAVSGLHVARIHRLTSDDPNAALEYYERNRDGISGKDHITVRQLVDPALTQRKANDWIRSYSGIPQAAAEVVQAITPFVIQQESAGDPTALSNKGAAGLMQVMPGTAREIAGELGYGAQFAGLDDASIQTMMQTNPELNQQFGMHYLGKQLKAYGGDLEVALIAYNGGPQRANNFLRSGRDPNSIPRESWEYSQKIMSRYEEYRNGGGSAPAERGGRVTRYGLAPVDNGDRMTAENWNLRHFTPDDLTAPTAGGAWVNAAAAQALDGVAEQFLAATGLRVKINEERDPNGSTSGRRRGTSDPADNPHVGNSMHLHGKAFDIQVQGWSDQQKAQFLTIARQAGFTGIGFYGPDGHLHIDTGKPRSWGPVPAWAREAMGVQPAQGGFDAPGVPAMRGPAGGVPVGSNAIPAVPAIPIPPITLDTAPGALELMQAQALQITDPGVRALVNQNISVMAAQQSAQQKAQSEALTQGAWSHLVNGGSMNDLDPQVLVGLGRTETTALMEFERKRADEGFTTDWSAWSEVSQMSPEQLASTDMFTGYRNRLGDTEFKQALEYQRSARATLAGDAAAGSQMAGLQTRQQLFTSTLNGAGIKPDSADAAQLNRQLDAQILAATQAKGKDLNSVEIQDLLDKLLISGRGRPALLTGRLRSESAYAVEDPETFVAAQSLDDIQKDDQQTMLQNYQKLYGTPPTQEDFVDTYNRAMRVYLGGTPAFASDDEEAWFTQGMNAGRAAPLSPDQLRNYYGEWLLSVIGVRPLPGGVR